MGQPRKYNVDTINTLVEEYKSGMSTCTLGEKYNINSAVVYKILKREGIKFRIRSRTKFSTKEQLEIVKSYKNGSTMVHLAKVFSCDRGTIVRVLASQGIDIRSRKVGCTNENVFESIDTKEKAYWLGFIVADGSVSDNDALYLGLKRSDWKHVEKFKKFVGYEGRCYFNKGSKLGTPSYSIRIGNTKLCQDLNKYGVVPRKTGSCYKSDLIPKALEKYFWRGVMDGDGTISFKSNNNALILSLVGDEKIIKSFQKYCQELTNTKAKTHYRNGVWYFNLTSNKAKTVFRDIYGSYDNSLHLDRKYELYELLVDKKFDWVL